MARTLVDEPVPPNLGQPSTGDRLTIDDLPAENRPTLDDIPGERRGPSPTLVDPPEPAGAAPRGPSPTLADGPPHAARTPAAAPLHVAPATPATPAPPLVAAAPPHAAPSPAPVGPQAPAIASPAPPPLAYPVSGAAPGAGLLAQLPAMPANRAAFAPPAASPQPPLAQAPSHQAASPQAASPQAPSQQAASPQAASPQAPSQQAASPQAASPQAASPARVAPGGRTLVGVAPPSPPLADMASPDGRSTAQSPSGKYAPPGQTSSPDPLSATLPVTHGLVPAELRAAAGASAESPSPADTPAPERAAPRKSGARAVVAAVVAVLGVLAIAAVVAGYFFFFRYTPLAERHIPAASNLAIRADLRQIGTFGPVRKHLWPVLHDRPSQKTPGKTLADKVAEATDVNPAVDLREIIVASVDSRSWVALIGGSLSPGTFVSGMEKVLREEGYPGWQRSGDLLLGPGGIALGQAEDGTIVLGTEVEIVNAALPASDEHRRMALPQDGAVSFAVSKEAWEELARSTAAFDAGGSLRRIRHVTGTLALGDEPRVDIDIEPKGGESAETLGKDVETLLAGLRLGLVLFPDQMGEKTALSSAVVAVEAEHVRVRGPWPLEGLDRACAKLAALSGLE